MASEDDLGSAEAIKVQVLRNFPGQGKELLVPRWPCVVPRCVLESPGSVRLGIKS